MTRRPDPLLEHELRLLGRVLDLPEAPPLEAAVRARLAAGAARRPPAHHRRLRAAPRRTPRAALAGVVATVLLASVVLAASPAARTAVAGWLGVPGIGITVVEDLPQPEVETLRLGEPVTLARAQAHVDFRIVLPDLRADLDRAGGGVYLDERVHGGAVTIVYPVQEGLRPTRFKGTGALLTELRGDLEPDYLKKVAPDGTRVLYVEVDGEPGWWIEGRYHLLLRAPDGLEHPVESRLAGNTLLWTSDGVTLRLESALELDEALGIAATMRPADLP